MQQHAEWATGKPEEHWMVTNQAATAAFSGQLQKSRELRRQGVELAQRYNFKEAAAFIAALGALTEANFGNYQQARKQTEAALAIARGRTAQVSGAIALARAGDRSQAQALADDLTQRFPTDTLVNSVSLPTIRAAIEIRRGNPTKAIELLRAAAPYERAYLGTIYLRGEAYLRAEAGMEAAAEFQKILDLKGVWPNAPVHALARLGLARAYALAGDTAGARRAYQDFLALWKDADPDIPILQEAKAEYAQLR